jgi:hypothetical protein
MFGPLCDCVVIQTYYISVYPYVRTTVLLCRDIDLLYFGVSLCSDHCVTVPWDRPTIFRCIPMFGPLGYCAVIQTYYISVSPYVRTTVLLCRDIDLLYFGVSLCSDHCVTVPWDRPTIFRCLPMFGPLCYCAVIQTYYISVSPYVRTTVLLCRDIDLLYFGVSLCSDHCVTVPWYRHTIFRCLPMFGPLCYCVVR